MSQFIKEAAFSPSSPLLRNIVGRFVGKQALCLFRLHWLGGGTGQRKCTHTPTRGRARLLVVPWEPALGTEGWFSHPFARPSLPSPQIMGRGRRPRPRPEANSSGPQLCEGAKRTASLHLALQSDGAGAMTASYSQSKLGLEPVRTAKNQRNWDSKVV